MAESRCSVMYIDIELKGMNKKGEFEVRQIKKPIIIPIQDDKGFYTIKGKKYYLIYQMVDKMLYPSFNAVTTKSLMPSCVRIENGDFEVIDGQQRLTTLTLIMHHLFKNGFTRNVYFEHRKNSDWALDHLELKDDIPSVFKKALDSIEKHWAIAVEAVAPKDLADFFLKKDRATNSSA